MRWSVTKIEVLPSKMYPRQIQLIKELANISKVGHHYESLDLWSSYHHPPCYNKHVSMLPSTLLFVHVSTKYPTYQFDWESKLVSWGSTSKKGKAEYAKLTRMSLLGKDKSPELPRRCLSIPVKIREKSWTAGPVVPKGKPKCVKGILPNWHPRDSISETQLLFSILIGSKRISQN